MATSYRSYSHYIRSNGGKWNFSLMTESQFANYADFHKSAKQLELELEARLSDCYDAEQNAKEQGLYVDAEHAAINGKNAYVALIKFRSMNCVELGLSESDANDYHTLARIYERQQELANTVKK
jgi:hypothetical protein